MQLRMLSEPSTSARISPRRQPHAPWNTTNMSGRYKVKGKKGTFVREGCETSTPKICDLKHGTIVYAVEEGKNAKGDSRLRITRPCGGWLSAKTVAKAKAEDLSRPAPAKRAGGEGVDAGEWPQETLALCQVETTQRFVNLFGSGPTRSLQYSTMPKHWTQCDDGSKRIYFESVGGIVPCKPGDAKAPLVRPRCSDPLPEAVRTQVPNVHPPRYDYSDASTPANYCEAALRCSAGAPAGFDDEGASLGDDDDVYAKLWKPTPEGRGLPLLVKHAFDPWSQAFLECENGFVNVGPEARALRGVDMRSFYDARGATLHAAVRYGPEAQGARSLVWILDLVHGGCIETVLHEALVEALKCTEDSEAIVVDFRCDIKVRYAGVLICFDKAARKISKTLRRTRFRNHRSLRILGIS